MTTAADDATVEDAFEAILAGRPAPRGAAGLAAFTGAVRTTATSPGRPSAALADLLANGLLVDQSSPSARTARSAGTPPSRASRNRIRRRTAMFFPALLAKLLSAGAVAQAATGATVVVVAFAGAGAVGVLPGPVQDTFTAIVSDETEVTAEEEVPLEETPVVEEPVEEPVEELPVEEVPVPVDEVPVDEPVEPTAEEVVDAWMDEEIVGSFGAWVSGARHDADLMAAIRASGHNFGYYVSQRAKEKGLTAEDLVEEGVALEGGAVVEEPADAPEVAETEPRTQERGNRGNGNGRGNGGGNGNGGGHGNGRN
jgi:hypothetical protein